MYMETCREGGMRYEGTKQANAAKDADKNRIMYSPTVVDVDAFQPSTKQKHEHISTIIIIVVVVVVIAFAIRQYAR